MPYGLETTHDLNNDLCMKFSHIKIQHKRKASDSGEAKKWNGNFNLSNAKVALTCVSTGDFSLYYWMYWRCCKRCERAGLWKKVIRCF